MKTLSWVGLAALALTACGGTNVTQDAGTEHDAGPSDAGTRDASIPDAGSPDAGGCMPISCYDGPPGTLDAGLCHAGTRSCLPDGGFGACTGEVVPTDEICGNGLDEDCSGGADDPPDLDHDGFNSCQGDCCETVDAGCANPAAVNPAAFDVPANSIDDDCNGATDDAPTCDTGLASDTTTTSDFAKAIELCRVGSATLPGLLDGGFSFTDGAGTPAAGQHAVRASFGTNLQPKAGAALVVLSTGQAAATGQTNPGAAAVEPGFDHGNSSGLPADWLAASSGAVPVLAACPAVVADAAHDPVMLTLQLRVPSNAHAFAFDVNYLTSDFPEGVCGPDVDVFVALLDSTFNGTPANPADKNVAAFSGGKALTADMAFGNTGDFTQCLNGATGCSGGTAGTLNTRVGSSELVGTGFDVVDNECTAGGLSGGGTGWRTAQGNVVPGELITLRLALWDSSDGLYDSTVLIDNFRWLDANVTPGLR